MESNSDSPISTLKVDFGCSRDCPTDVKNMLQQLKGVKSISIDPNQGKVTVVGNVSPMMLIKLLQKMGRKAQLWSFDKAPLQNTAGSYPKQKQNSHCCCESSHSEEDSDTDIHDAYVSCKHKQHRARHGQRSKKRHSRKYHFGSADKHQAPPPVTGYQPPMPGYQPYTGYQPPMPGHQPYTGYHLPMQHQPVTYARPLTYARPVPSYGHYGRVLPVLSSYRHPRFDSRFLPEQNPMIHYTSYADNYRYAV